jgi:hypothetical protein
VGWQTAAVVLAVALAGVYLARQTLRTWRGRGSGCGGGCQCPSSSASRGSSPAGGLIGVDELTTRLRGGR